MNIPTKRQVNPGVYKTLFQGALRLNESGYARAREVNEAILETLNDTGAIIEITVADDDFTDAYIGKMVVLSSGVPAMASAGPNTETALGVLVYRNVKENVIGIQTSGIMKAKITEPVTSGGYGLALTYDANGDVRPATVDDTAIVGYLLEDTASDNEYVLIQFNPVSPAQNSLAASLQKESTYIFVDPVFGNDDTAQAYQPGRPFQTVANALTASTTGDTIILKAGTHVIGANILRDGISIHCEPGVIINYNGATPMINADTTASGITLTENWRLTGYPTITGGTSTYLLGIRTNPNANIYLQLGNITWNNNSNMFIVRDGNLIAEVKGNMVGAGGGIRMQDTGNAYFYVTGNIETTQTGLTAATVNINAGFNFSGRLYVEANDIKCASTVGLATPMFLMGLVANANVIIKLKEVVDAIASSNPYIWLYPGGGDSAAYVDIEISHINLTQRRLFDAHHSNLNLTIKSGVAQGAVVDDSGKVTIHGTALVNLATINVDSQLTIYNSIINSSAAAVSPVTLTANAIFASVGSSLISDGTDPIISVTGSPIIISDAIDYTTNQSLSGPGAINLVTKKTNITTTGTDAFTLADGYNGQIKIITMVTDGGDGTLTPSTPFGYATIVFDAVGDNVTLEFIQGSGWVVRNHFGCTIS